MTGQGDDMEMIGQMWDEIGSNPSGESLTMRCKRGSARRVSVDVEDFACGAVGIQVCDCGGSSTAFVQEDECDVIRLWIFLSQLMTIS